MECLEAEREPEFYGERDEVVVGEVLGGLAEFARGKYVHDSPTFSLVDDVAQHERNTSTSQAHGYQDALAECRIVRADVLLDGCDFGAYRDLVGIQPGNIPSAPPTCP